MNEVGYLNFSIVPNCLDFDYNNTIEKLYYESIGKHLKPYLTSAASEYDTTLLNSILEIPKLDSMYKANWMSKDVKVIAVNINNKEKAAWKNFINEHQLTQWINAYQTDEDFNKEVAEGRPTTIRQLYDVFKTPTFYLLDKDKKIVAKNLSIEQFNDFILSTQKK